GNICRSPFAEALVRNAGYDECRSAGTENYHVGKKADAIAIEVAQEFGIDLTSHIARQVQRDDIELAECVIIMDIENLNRLNELFGETLEGLPPINLLGEYLRKELVDIPDPYRKTKEEYRRSFKLIEECCQALIQTL
ncbi:MAG: low molecular weight protein-tyrosine-phosphatase, partial [bacterium]